MNMLHPYNHHHVYFQLRKKDKSSPCVSLLRTRCKSSSERSPSPWSRRERGGGVAARDRIISFGKYKGKMLGSVPSRYLKWVSRNLRAGELEEWARLADQVLEDPFYRDRIEWELALSVLTGDNLRTSSSSTAPAVSLLLDISDRFGWDNHDKLAWSKVDFDLLGTSQGGRIPRRPLVTHTHATTSTTHAPLQHKQPHPHPHPPTSTPVPVLNNSIKSGTGTRRMQRRERQKTMRLRTQPRPLPLQPQQQNDDGDGDCEMVRHNHNHSQNPIANPFPGRQALLANLHRPRAQP